MKISILSYHPSFIIQKGLESFVKENPTFFWCGEVSAPAELKKHLERNKPHILIVDGIQQTLNRILISDIKKISSHTKLLSISDRSSKEAFSLLLEAGVTACLLNECDYQEVTDAILSSSRGERFLCGKIAGILANDFIENERSASETVSCEGFGITDREAEIIQFIAAGYSNKQIADKLFLSTHTVNTHRKNIMAKLRVSNTAGLVMYAIRNKLLEPNQFLFAN